MAARRRRGTRTEPVVLHSVDAQGVEDAEVVPEPIVVGAELLPTRPTRPPRKPPAPTPEPAVADAEPAEAVDAEVVNEDGDEPPAVAYDLAEGQPQLRDAVPWPDATREWWGEWGRSQQAAGFTGTDWQMLMDIALLHAAVWGSFDLSMVPRLNAAVAKFGGTPLDRAVLLAKKAADEAIASAPAALDGPDAKPASRAEMRRRLQMVEGGRAS